MSCDNGLIHQPHIMCSIDWSYNYSHAAVLSYYLINNKHRGLPERTHTHTHTLTIHSKIEVHNTYKNTANLFFREDILVNGNV